MKRFAIIITSLLGGVALANSAPVVSNVTASQRTDGSRKVDISYDLAAGNACTVSVLASSDGGATWSVPVKTFGTGSAVGPGVTPGTNKLIVWDCGADLPGQVGSFKVRVLADDGQGQLPPGGGMVLIPAGEFMMGDTFNEGWSAERPVHAVYVSAFYMDRYEVTNQQYAEALNWAWSQGGHITVTNNIVYQAGSGTSFPYCDTTTSSSYSRITWNGTTFGVVSGYGNHPMARVSWYGAVAFCNWRSAMQGRTPCYNLSTWACNFNANGYRLPTEAEWEKAARGGVAGQRFPWGANINHDHANYSANGSAYTYDTSPYTTWTCHPTFNTGNMPYTSPVGYFAPNGYGLHDMAGNVYEWCNDWYSDTYYNSSPYSNPRGPASGPSRVIRGGSWYISALHCRVAYRNFITPDHRFLTIGFRLALGSE